MAIEKRRYFPLPRFIFWAVTPITGLVEGVLPVVVEFLLASESVAQAISRDHNIAIYSAVLKLQLLLVSTVIYSYQYSII